MLLKDIYSVSFYEQFTNVLEEVIPDFDKDEFKRRIFVENWVQKELKDRMKHTSLVLHQFLPHDFEQAAQVIKTVIAKLRERNMTKFSLEFMFFPDYIEVYGLEHFTASVDAFEYVTQFTSCEFAVRPFIIKYGPKMIEQMQNWSLHENHHVRRLASEGSRPRLPWAIALPELKKNPLPILPLLENLKSDPSEYVRRSVANNLNDISKDNPHIVTEIAQRWKGLGKETDAIIRHGCRTLLKQGDSNVLKYFDLSYSSSLEVENFKILTTKLKVGEDLRFSFTLHNNDSKTQLIRLEYGLFYLRQNGRHSKKVFKISEKKYESYEKVNVVRKQSFKVITTRRFYPGRHQLSIIINGIECAVGEFELEAH